MSKLSTDPMAVAAETGLPPLSRANLMAAALELRSGVGVLPDLARFVLDFAAVVESLPYDCIIRDINEDRAVAGFPEVQGLEQLEEVVVGKRRYYSGAVIGCMNKLPARALVAVMTLIAEQATGNGEHTAPELVYEVVDRYEVEAQGFLNAEAENIRALITATVEVAVGDLRAVDVLLERLEEVARNWDAVAQPIQLAAKSRGVEHHDSKRLGRDIRGLALTLFNDHDMLVQTTRITNLLRDVFAELPELSEQVGEDTVQLKGIERDRRISAIRARDRLREMSCQLEIGGLFKHTFSISAAGIAWKQRSYPLATITRVRWGGIRHSVNGIPTGCTYTIAFGDAETEAIVELKNQSNFEAIIGKLWMAVGPRLLTELLETLRRGGTVRFGEVLIKDTGVVFLRRKFLAAEESVDCPWVDIKVWVSDGYFCIGSKSDQKLGAALSYINDRNVHILEHAIRAFFKDAEATRLSAILFGE